MRITFKKIIIRILFVTAVAVIISSCGTVVNFPTSEILPAADVKAQVKKNDNNIYKIKLAANHLADPKRLNPKKKYYIVWLSTNDDEKIRLGELNPNRSKKAELTTMTPRVPNQLFVTAEDIADPEWPSSMVIFRSKVF